jgi:hypothetical protein
MDLEDNETLRDEKGDPIVMQHLVLNSQCNGTRVRALLDPGSHSQFISTSLAHNLHNNLFKFQLKAPKQLTFANGKPSQRITEAALVMLQLGDNPSNQHYEQVLCYIADV